jgi:hypothetical protein
MEPMGYERPAFVPQSEDYGAAGIEGKGAQGSAERVGKGASFKRAGASKSIRPRSCGTSAKLESAVSP